MLISGRKSRRRILSHELIPVDAGAGFVMHQHHVSHWTMAWHRHPELELTLIVRGDGRRFVSDSVQSFTDGDLVLLGPGVPHTWTSQPRSDGLSESVIAQFPVDVLGKGWRDGAETRGLVSVFERSMRGLKIDGATAAAIRPLLISMLALRPGPLRLGKLLTILGHLAAAPANEVKPIARLPAPDLPSIRADDPWNGLVRHLHDHVGDTMLMAGLAARMRLSPASFARAFRRRFGCTATEYLTRLRLAKVCRQLVESDAPIADLAFAAGFANLANFNRRFRRFHGMTPGVWRRRHHAGEVLDTPHLADAADRG